MQRIVKPKRMMKRSVAWEEDVKMLIVEEDMERDLEKGEHPKLLNELAPPSGGFKLPASIERYVAPYLAVSYPRIYPKGNEPLTLSRSFNPRHSTSTDYSRSWHSFTNSSSPSFRSLSEPSYQEFSSSHSSSSSTSSAFCLMVPTVQRNDESWRHRLLPRTEMGQFFCRAVDRLGSRICYKVLGVCTCIVVWS